MRRPCCVLNNIGGATRPTLSMNVTPLFLQVNQKINDSPLTSSQLRRRQTVYRNRRVVALFAPVTPFRSTRPNFPLIDNPPVHVRLISPSRHVRYVSECPARLALFEDADSGDNCFPEITNFHEKQDNDGAQDEAVVAFDLSLRCFRWYLLMSGVRHKTNIRSSQTKQQQNCFSIDHEAVNTDKNRWLRNNTAEKFVARDNHVGKRLFLAPVLVFRRRVVTP